LKFKVMAKKFGQFGRFFFWQIHALILLLPKWRRDWNLGWSLSGHAREIWPMNLQLQGLKPFGFLLGGVHKNVQCLRYPMVWHQFDTWDWIKQNHVFSISFWGVVEHP
jgi:hypothetical protein